MFRLISCLVAVLLTAALLGGAGSARATGDPLCTGSYGGTPRAGGVRFGIDPGLAGSFGGVQAPAVADDPSRDLAAVKALAPAGRTLVVRMNRLFWSDGQAGIAAFERSVAAYTRAGFEVELQVRYHPVSGEAGDIAAWDSYVRHVVDTFGPNPRVVAMTITNEVNIQLSPNTSDGYYAGAEDALISGIETAHAESVRRGFRQLSFGFTYAYRFVPTQDAAFFAYLASHGGAGLRAALGFVGLDFYPGTVYPPVMLPGDTYRAELVKAAGVLRHCYLRMAGIAPAVPIWITENGVPTGLLSESEQAAALSSLVRAVHDYAATFGITDYRWFNLRDSVSSGPATLVALSFATDGLLRADYTEKPSFAAYRSLIAQFAASSPPPVWMHHPGSGWRHRRPGRPRIS